MSAMTFGSFFAGIGGFDLGLERAGLECKWQVEWDAYCQQVLAKHWPNVERHSDIRKVQFEELYPVDLICGGFPCQDLSTAGSTTTGLDGERSGLWWEMLRAICVVRPRFFLVENVAAILVRAMETFLGSVAESGFDAEWDCLPASDFGAPHKRDRFFALAYPNQVNGKAWMGLLPNWTPPIFAGSPRLRSPAWIQAPPERHGMDDGVPAGVYRDRVGALGNAVCPPIAEWIGRRIVEADSSVSNHTESRIEA